MSWERRQRGRGTGYYYRSVRINGRAVKKYLGLGKAAQEAARLVEERRQARVRLREEEIQLASLDLLLADFRAWLGLLVRAQMIIGGLYEHHGGWRRRRRRQSQPAASTA